MAKIKFSRFLRLPHPGHRAARCHSTDLCPVVNHTDRIKQRDLLVFTTCRNEAIRLPFFLDYYRGLGVDHFLFVDNDSSDGTCEILSEHADCSVWTTSASYKNSNFGVHWLNHLLRQYGTGHWCLTLDPDEFLVIPYHSSRDIKELCVFLETNKKESFFSVLLDMYPRGSVDEAVYTAGQDPLEIAPWFDPAGYHQDQRPQRDWWIRGGVRRRVFFADNPDEAPALNKTVLVKWRKSFLYLSSTHVLRPFRLNEPHFRDDLCPTGCLLHFKYLALFKQKVGEEIQRQQHSAGSREYLRYAAVFEQHDNLWCEGSAKFDNWQQLADLGLMTPGRWF